MHIGGLLSRHARYRPNHTAVIVGDARLTYREFNARVNKVAHALLGLGLTKGDKIATVLPNCMELLEVYWAAAKIGLVVVPMSTLLRGQGLATLLRDSDTAAVVTDGAHAPVIDAIRSDLLIDPARFLITDAADHPGYHDYHALVAPMSEGDPTGIELCSDDPVQHHVQQRHNRPAEGDRSHPRRARRIRNDLSRRRTASRRKASFCTQALSFSTAHS
jgi:long-chain acyl-CoA synthetase